MIDSSFGQMMHNVFGNFDMAIFSAFAFVQNDIFTAIAQFFTAIGEPSFGIMLFILGMVFCFFKRTRKIGHLILFATGVFFILNNIILKNFFFRIRPYNALQGNSEFFQWYLNVGAVSESETCFPSGHSAYAFSIATVLFFWIKNDCKKSECWMVFIPAAFVALSRVYLMVHYPTDIIAGTIEGIAIGCAVWYGVKLLKFFENKYVPKLADKNIDFEKRFEKKTNRKMEINKVLAIVILCVLCFWVTSFSKNTLDSAEVQRCSHEGPDYICMNKAYNEVYDNASGKMKYYCDLHE